MKKILEWVLSYFDSSTTHQDLRNIVPNGRHAIMWCFQVWREMNPQIIRNKWRMSKILLADWSANFIMNREHEKLRMKEQQMN